MPVLPKLAKEGVFGKNAILEMSLKSRECGFVVVPSVSDGGAGTTLSERGHYTGTCGEAVSKMGYCSCVGRQYPNLSQITKSEGRGQRGSSKVQDF